MFDKYFEFIKDLENNEELFIEKYKQFFNLNSFNSLTPISRNNVFTKLRHRNFSKIQIQSLFTFDIKRNIAFELNTLNIEGVNLKYKLNGKKYNYCFCCIKHFIEGGVDLYSKLEKEIFENSSYYGSGFIPCKIHLNFKESLLFNQHKSKQDNFKINLTNIGN